MFVLNGFVSVKLFCETLVFVLNGFVRRVCLC